MNIKLIAIIVLAFIISCATAQTTRTENTTANAASPMANRAENAALPLENQPTRVPGEFYSESKELSDAIAAPATVAADKDFQVTITTSGNGCVSMADEGVILAEGGADIFVYDFTSATRPGTMCTMIFKQFQHRVTLRFTKKGDAMIRAWGRRPGGAGLMGDPVVIEKRVTVK